MRYLLFPFLLLAAACGAYGQTPPPPDTLLSPEVHEDRKVTFRLRAPKAGEVSLMGDWMPVGKGLPMQKGNDGVWSISVGPMAPSIYIYTFNADGLTIADPVNPRIKLRARTSASLLEVSGSDPEVWQCRNVPHGTIEILTGQSRTITNETRQIWVYKPPGYDRASSKKYPVLYLLHGSNDTPAGWTMAGGANYILDNLIATKQAVPMIVVMPFGHAVPLTASRERQADNAALFEKYLLDEVVPDVEKRFRTLRDREHRSIVGLSMGGGQALRIGLGHMDQFSAVGAFSAAVPSDFGDRFKVLLDNPKTTNAKLKLLWVGCGRDDAAFERSRQLDEILTRHGIKHVFFPSEGGHTFTVWRQYLAKVLPDLFKR